MIHLDLLSLDIPPHRLASAGFDPYSLGKTWTWQLDVIMDIFDCYRDEIDLDDEDYITVRGERVATSKLWVSANT